MPILESTTINLKANGSLELNDVNKEDEGMYLCNISNGIGTPLQKTIVLKVIGMLNYTFSNTFIILKKCF